MSGEEKDRPTGADQIREFMANDPQIEALEISRDDHHIRVATLSPIDEEDLQERIESVLTQVQKDFGKLDSLTLDSGDQINAIDRGKTLSVLKLSTSRFAAQLARTR